MFLRHGRNLNFMKRSSITFFAALMSLGTVACGFAGQRPFAYSYDVMTTPPGRVEFENWTTWKAHKGSDSSYHKFEFKHEVEFGLTEHLQLSLYPATWEIVDNDEGSETAFKSANVSLVYNLTDPTADPLGSAVYFETGVGPEVYFIEGKLLLQKNVGNVSFVYNFVLEAEWEGDDYSERVGEIKNTFGISYQINPSLSVGIEGLHEVGFENWEEAGDNVFYLGPNISYRKGDFFATLAPLVQLTGLDDEADFSTRLLLGFTF